MLVATILSLLPAFGEQTFNASNKMSPNISMIKSFLHLNTEDKHLIYIQKYFVYLKLAFTFVSYDRCT